DSSPVRHFNNNSPSKKQENNNNNYTTDSNNKSNITNPSKFEVHFRYPDKDQLRSIQSLLDSIYFQVRERRKFLKRRNNNSTKQGKHSKVSTPEKYNPNLNENNNQNSV